MKVFWAEEVLDAMIGIFKTKRQAELKNPFDH
jgi:hypothetical protein